MTKWRVFSLLSFVIILVLAQHIQESLNFEQEWTACFSKALIAMISLILAIIFGLVALWQARHALYNTLPSASFAVTLLLFIAAATALGAFIPQNVADIALEERYGATILRWINYLFLAEIFRSLWFSGLLALLALSLILVILRRPFWRIDQCSLLLAHGGMVVLLIGAFIGARWGQQGILELRAGEIGDKIIISRGGVKTNRSVPLGFALRLDKFEIERHSNKLSAQQNISKPRSFCSYVSVLDGEKIVKQAMILVNSPMSYGGYEFYQSGWNEKDLTHSIFKVIYDPGLSVVYAGMLMIVVGIAVLAYCFQHDRGFID